MEYNDKDSQVKMVLQTLYRNCIERYDDKACRAWLRATGKMKLAMAKRRAAKSMGGDRPTFREIVKDLSKRSK